MALPQEHQTGYLVALRAMMPIKDRIPTDVGEAAPMEKWISLTPTNSAIPQKWKVCYAGANRCNGVLATMALAPDITPDKATLIEAQVRFLRAFYHFELKKVFGNIPYADETLTPGKYR